MEINDRLSLYETAINTWGEEAQRNMAFEELGELNTALARDRRGRATKEDVLTELADVSIMVEQMATIFGYDEFEKEKERKLNKLKNKLFGNDSQRIDRGIEEI